MTSRLSDQATEGWLIYPCHCSKAAQLHALTKTSSWGKAARKFLSSSKIKNANKCNQSSSKNLIRHSPSHIKSLSKTSKLSQERRYARLGSMGHSIATKRCRCCNQLRVFDLITAPWGTNLKSPCPMSYLNFLCTRKAALMESTSQ